MTGEKLGGGMEEAIGKGLDDACAVCGGESITRCGDTVVCDRCGAVYRLDEYAALFGEYNALPDAARITLSALKTELYAAVRSAAPDRDRIAALCREIIDVLPGDRAAEFYAATCADDAALAAYYDRSDPTACAYLVRELLLYAADRERAVRSACRLVKRARDAGVEIDAQLEARLEAAAEKLTVRYRAETKLRAARLKAGQNGKRFFTAVGHGLKKFFGAVGHGTKRCFLAVGHGLKRFFGAVGHGLKRFFGVIWQSIKKLPSATGAFFKRSWRGEPPTSKVCVIGSSVSLFFALLYSTLSTFLPVTTATITACKAMFIVSIVIAAIMAAYVLMCMVHVRLTNEKKNREIYMTIPAVWAVYALSTLAIIGASEPLRSILLYSLYITLTAIWSVVCYKVCRKRNDISVSCVWLSLFLSGSAIMMNVAFVLR